MRLLLISALASAAFAPAFAQDIDDILVPEESEPISELDALSQTSDNPFEGVIETIKREPVSVTLRALDKITARYIDIEIPINTVERFGSLELLPRTCDKRPPEEFPETTVFLEVFDIKPGKENAAAGADLSEAAAEGEAPGPTLDEVREDMASSAALRDETAMGLPELGDIPQPETTGDVIFRGWLFESSPSINAIEHPVYDVWVIDCKTREVSN